MLYLSAWIKAVCQKIKTMCLFMMWIKSSFRPSNCNIDVASAEHFVYNEDGQDWIWIRDKDFVYHDETKLDVDRNTFAPLGKTFWWTDRDYVYMDSWNSSLNKWEVIKADSLQSPIDTLNVGSHYLRNGRNIIYLANVIARDIEVYRFEEVGLVNVLLMICCLIMETTF